MPIVTDVGGGPVTTVADRTNADPEILRAVRGFAQRMRMARGVASATVHMLLLPFDGGGAAVPAGQISRAVVGWDCEIIEWRIVSGAVGTFSCDIARAAWGSYPTTTSIVGASPPSMVGAPKAFGPPIGWTRTRLRDGDVLVATAQGTPSVDDALVVLRVKEI